MDAILLLAAISVVVFILGFAWKSLRRSQRRSRRRGNNYLHQDYDYDYVDDTDVIDLAWEKDRKNIEQNRELEVNEDRIEFEVSENRMDDDSSSSSFDTGDTNNYDD